MTSSVGGDQAHRVLVADDVKVIAQSISWALEEAGYETAIARDGEECLELARSFDPHVLILDLMMPKIHGIEVLQRLKADDWTRHIAVIVCTVKGFRTEIGRAKQLGVADLVIKPFEPKDLISKVEKALSSRQEATMDTSKFLVRPSALVDQVTYRPELDAGQGLFQLWGTRGSIPISGPETIRHGGNTSCMTLEYGDELVIFDAGSGIRNLGLALARSNPRRLHLFITHTHWDHIQGFPFFAPAFIPGFEITIYGARGFNKNLESLFKGQFDPDYFPIQMENMDAKLEFTYLGDQPVHIGDLKIFWEFTQHPGPTLGYKIELPETTLAFVPDNEIFQGYMGPPEDIPKDRELLALYEPMIDFLRGTDILVHEAQYTPEEYRQTMSYGHSSVANACFLAKATEARRWIVTHHDPLHSDDFLRDKLNLTRQLLASLDHPIHVSNGYDGLIEYL
ncbi:MAG: response regulator [Acidobacteriota bacterium]